MVGLREGANHPKQEIARETRTHARTKTGVCERKLATVLRTHDSRTAPCKFVTSFVIQSSENRHAMIPVPCVCVQVEAVPMKALIVVQKIKVQWDKVELEHEDNQHGALGHRKCIRQVDPEICRICPLTTCVHGCSSI